MWFPHMASRTPYLLVFPVPHWLFLFRGSEVFLSSCCRAPGPSPLVFSFPLHSLSQWSHPISCLYQHMPTTPHWPLHSKSKQQKLINCLHKPALPELSPLQLIATPLSQLLRPPDLEPLLTPFFLYFTSNPLAGRESNPTSPTSYNCSANFISHLSPSLLQHFLAGPLAFLLAVNFQHSCQRDHFKTSVESCDIPFPLTDKT